MAEPSAIVLVAVPQSVYCAKVRGALRFKNIPFTEREPDGGSYQTTEYQQFVAAGSVPAVEVEGRYLHDSQAIVEFLEEQYDGPSLWSAEPWRRGLQRAIMNYHDSKLEPAVRALVPLIGGTPGPDHDLALGVARDRLYDRLFRLDRLLLETEVDRDGDVFPGCWTIPCSVAIAVDLLGFMDRVVEIPGAFGEWLAARQQDEIAASERDRVRQAIATWLALRAGAGSEFILPITGSLHTSGSGQNQIN